LLSYLSLPASPFFRSLSFSALFSPALSLARASLPLALAREPRGEKAIKAARGRRGRVPKRETRKTTARSLKKKEVEEFFVRKMDSSIFFIGFQESGPQGSCCARALAPAAQAPGRDVILGGGEEQNSSLIFALSSFFLLHQNNTKKPKTHQSSSLSAA